MHEEGVREGKESGVKLFWSPTQLYMTIDISAICFVLSPDNWPDRRSNVVSSPQEYAMSRLQAAVFCFLRTALMRPKSWKHHQIMQNILAAESPICLKTGIQPLQIHSLTSSSQTPGERRRLMPSSRQRNWLLKIKLLVLGYIITATDETLTQLADAKAHTPFKFAVEGEHTQVVSWDTLSSNLPWKSPVKYFSISRFLSIS